MDHLKHLGPASLALVTSMGWEKISVAVVAVVGAVVLTALGKLDSSATVGIISAVLGYVFGAAGVSAGMSQAVTETMQQSPPAAQEPPAA